ncbi:competence protein ComEA [Melghirimyces profundicolus]|uniref:Competence protein ComEA n=1 Tax=Melghirimyces profundicolus TaxID=1242148 RepID=A0A2T6C966_9BACL|nr:helix-hairpin-helix domain-containing protein [Melghirimyces profundicolus]PTX64816.1 competence protein ComEA [Melghirimyces profundicolus]
MWEDGWTLREKILVGVAGVMTLGLLGTLAFLWTGEEEPEDEPGLAAYEPRAEAAPEKDQKKEPPAEIVVDVKGEVKKPGVYRFAPGARAEEAVRKAGGPGKKADMDRVNLAQPLSDGMALYIPAEGEEAPAAGVSPENGGPAGVKINVNTASGEELQELNGVGPSKAEAIIRYREENGPFTSVDQLTEVPGIGEKTLEQWGDQVTVN